MDSLKGLHSCKRSRQATEELQECMPGSEGHRERMAWGGGYLNRVLLCVLFSQFSLGWSQTPPSCCISLVSIGTPFKNYLLLLLLLVSPPPRIGQRTTFMISFFFPPSPPSLCVFWGSNSDCQACVASSLPTEPSC